MRNVNRASFQQEHLLRRQAGTRRAYVAALWLAIFGAALGRCAESLAAESSTVTRYTVQILKTLPHDPNSFTQGLLYHQGMLYESTGLLHRSTLQKIDAATGTVLASLPVPGVFAEGLALWEDRLIQLTWQDRHALIYKAADFTPLGRFSYDTEGWGLTADERSLIMSDGTETLYFRDPQTFLTQRTIRVTFRGAPLTYLNELEYIDGVIYANVWHEDFIVQISPSDGQVIGVIDARPLYQMLPPLGEESVLNGIARNTAARTLYLTGKHWPKFFEVTLIPVF